METKRYSQVGSESSCIVVCTDILSSVDNIGTYGDDVCRVLAFPYRASQMWNSEGAHEGWHPWRDALQCGLT